MHTDTRDRRPHAAELKFLVSPADGDAIRTWARAHLTADPHGNGPNADEYTTTTLYTDTPEQDVYRRQGSYGRSKYRVRRYGASDVVFLERKLRTKSLLSKRRSIVPMEELVQLQSTASVDTPWVGDWF
ncbi:MAG: VTC domain-containing protein, partial [Rhodospirillales bacterium]|nr:VTC domain-containing protein [Rhodospirillales bacterium]